MTDIILEIVRAFIVGFIFLYLLLTGRREEICTQKGWFLILSGLALLFLGMVIDITDNFPTLNKYIIFGDTEIQAFLEKFVGYLLGFLLLAIGFWKWMPMVIALKKADKALKKSHDELELKVEERTTDLIEINNELELEIAERYRADNALRESEGKYQSLIANIPSVTWITDSEGHTTFISPNIKGIFGYTPAEICGDGERLWFDRIHADDIANVKEAYSGLFESNGHFDVEYRIKRKDGQWIWLYDRAVTIFEKNGLKYAYGVFTDITRRKSVELERERLIIELQDALAEVKNLNGMLPICSSCKKIRDDQGYWTQVEVYIHKHSDAEFSHGICPECAKALYPKYFKDTDCYDRPG